MFLVWLALHEMFLSTINDISINNIRKLIKYTAGKLHSIVLLKLALRETGCIDKDNNIKGNMNCGIQNWP